MNYKKIIFIINYLIMFSLMFNFSAPTAQAMTPAEMQALIQQLQQQIAEIKRQIEVRQVRPVAWCHNFRINLRRGNADLEVQALITALTREGLLVEKPERTFHFDEEVAAAVVDFQEKHREHILTPLHLPRGTGIVGPATRARLNALYGCGVVNLNIIERILGWGHRVPPTPRLIDTIIIHSSYDALGDNPHSVEGMINVYRIYGVANHYLIARDGAIYRLVYDENIAFHAGVSKMPDNRTNVNTFSIGITLIYRKLEEPNKVQYQSLVNLIKYLRKKYNIPLNNILGHVDISPKRKTDPWNFNWQKFNEMLKNEYVSIL